MKLGVVFGYWGAGPRVGFVEEAQAAERLGYDSVWVAESWGNDAFTYAAYVAANTSTIKIGTGIVQMAARTPTATTMAAVTLDHLSNGRLVLGVGIGDTNGPDFAAFGEETDARRRAFEDWQVDAAMMREARHDALFMHCLPAHRGEEVAAEVIDGPQSVVWDEAENRLHAQKALLEYVVCGRVAV